MIDFERLRILDVAQERGPVADLTLFRQNHVHLAPEVWLLADSGYQGVQMLHPQTVVPVKKSKGASLAPEVQRCNARLAKLRIRVEHVICWLKTFRILKERYRNRRKRLGLRFSLIAGIHNLELDLR